MPATKTDLIDRYLQAVKLWLPRKQQNDILAEIAEDLHSQIEDRESALGHPLEEADLVALLKQRGSPMRVAAGYIPEYRLINPAMLPMYWMVLKIVLLWVLAPLFALVFIGPIFDSKDAGLALSRFIVEAWRAAFFTIGIVTVVFVMLDRYHGSWVDKWDPRKLPRLAPAHQPMQWWNDFCGFALGIGAFIFWAVMMWQRSAFVFEGGFRILLAPIWGQIYWLVLGLTLVRALVDLYCFLRPTWTRTRSWIRIAFDAAAILMPLVLLKVSNWVDIAGPNLTPAAAAKTAVWLNGMIRSSLICMAVIPLFDVVAQFRRLYRARNNRPATILTVS
jgi:hypothetical protein